MDSRKIGTVVVVVLLVLGGSLLLPSSAQEGRENTLLQRVEVLEGQVTDLLARVEILEGGGNACACDVLNLEPLDDFPAEPSEGDLCIKKEVMIYPNPPGDVMTKETLFLWCYLDGEWRIVSSYAIDVE